MAFAEVIRSEITTVVSRLSASPSLVVISGGSEVGQQAAMMGLPREMRDVPLAETVIPEVLAGCSDVAYVAGFAVGRRPALRGRGRPVALLRALAHILRPSTMRRANVRFASERLAFANLPDDRHFASQLDPRQQSERWPLASLATEARLGISTMCASIIFRRLWNEDGRSLRSSEPKRWLQLSRAITRRGHRADDRRMAPSSLHHGWRTDMAVARLLRPGAGWGLADPDGRLKSAFYALRRASQPLRLSITDEGTNGLYLHLVNDTRGPPQAN